MPARYLPFLCAVSIIGASEALSQEAQEAQEVDQAEAIIELVKLLTREDDLTALERARWLLMMNKTPAEVLDVGQFSPGHTPDSSSIPRIQKEALSDVGVYVIKHPTLFPTGLPDLPEDLNVYRLAPVFNGFWGGGRRDASEAESELSALMTDTWLAAAEQCGQVVLSSRVRIFRGQLPELLRSAENGNDELKIMTLGAAVRMYPDALEAVPPEEYKMRTLAVFLSGALIDREISGVEVKIISSCLSWWKAHPGLFGELKTLQGEPESALLTRIGNLWVRGERRRAWQMLFQIDFRKNWEKYVFAGNLLTHSDLSDKEIEDYANIILDEDLIWLSRWSSHDGLKKEEATRLRGILKKVMNSKGIHNGVEGNVDRRRKGGR
jgi:hypothetical protein